MSSAAAQRPLKVIVIGGGIGGLTAAGALIQHGFDVEVYERAPAMGEVGAGLQLGPNALKVARALGLLDELRKTAAEPLNIVSVRYDTAELNYREPLRSISQERYGAPYFTAHRADLHALLARLVPENRIHLQAECTGFEATPGGVVVRFADGSQREADVVIGADGIHSVVRRQIFGADKPRFTNQICWRAMVPIDLWPKRIGPGGSVAIERDEYVAWLGPTGHVICYPIRGGEMMNIFAGRVWEEWVDESWSVPSSAQEMLSAYAGWNEALLNVFAQVGQSFKWGIYDRDPLPKWTHGAVTLLGDAAHPMMPTLAQGAAISMEDGYAVARHLASRPGDPLAALEAYDQERRPRASRVQLQARQQFENNRKSPAPPPLDRDWIFRHDATVDPAAQAPA
ncbi:MAG: hypothetical protein JWN93_652 [Hyphomicrobiales bacterium]|nr:hypothetical protein [Hyphomicrobiales bacterium]